MPDEQPTKVYTTDAIEITWHANRCVHSAICLQGLPAVFDARRRPWIVLDAAGADAIAAVVAHCPSGALHVRRLDGGAQEQPDAEPVVTPIPDGPLAVRGNIRVLDGDGALIRADTRMTLCRCGGSANKPFCDNTHRLIGFYAP